MASLFYKAAGFKGGRYRKSFETAEAITAGQPNGYFQWVAEQLTSSDFAVYAIDLRGRGNSDGERYYIEDYSLLIQDIDKLVDIAQAAHPSLKMFCWATAPVVYFQLCIALSTRTS